MTVASLFWGKAPLNLSRDQLTVPLAVYLINFAFGAVITVAQLDARFWIPTALSAFLGVVPAIALWWIAKPNATMAQLETVLQVRELEEPPIVPVGVSEK